MSAKIRDANIAANNGVFCSMTNRMNKVPTPALISDRYVDREHNEFTPTSRFITWLSIWNLCGNVFHELLRDHEQIRMEANGGKSQFTMDILEISQFSLRIFLRIIKHSRHNVFTNCCPVSIVFMCRIWLKIYRNFC